MSFPLTCFGRFKLAISTQRFGTLAAFAAGKFIFAQAGAPDCGPVEAAYFHRPMA